VIRSVEDKAKEEVVLLFRTSDDNNAVLDRSGAEN
jgi:hypothetical protein